MLGGIWKLFGRNDHDDKTMYHSKNGLKLGMASESWIIVSGGYNTNCYNRSHLFRNALMPKQTFLFNALVILGY